MPMTEASVISARESWLNVLPNTRAAAAGPMPSTAMEISEDSSIAVPGAEK